MHIFFFKGTLLLFMSSSLWSALTPQSLEILPSLLIFYLLYRRVFIDFLLQSFYSFSFLVKFHLVDHFREGQKQYYILEAKWWVL